MSDVKTINRKLNQDENSKTALISRDVKNNTKQKKNYSLFNLRLLLLITITSKMAITAVTTTATTAPTTGPTTEPTTADVDDGASDVETTMTFPPP